MDIIVNGETIVVPETVNTMEQLITHMKIQSPVIIAERNGTILKQEDHTKTEVTDGDTIELVQFVGGG